MSGDAMRPITKFTGVDVNNGTQDCRLLAQHSGRGNLWKAMMVRRLEAGWRCGGDGSRGGQ
eukprot:4537064-Pyramimonas_sp.AAC.1